MAVGVDEKLFLVGDRNSVAAFSVKVTATIDNGDKFRDRR
jgi:hypothetical protein